VSTLPERKRCTKCGEEKPVTEFFVRNKRTGALRGCCKACHTAGCQPRDEAEAERRRAYYREHAREHRDECRERKRQWEAANRDRVNAYARQYQAAHRDYRQAYNAANAEKIKAQNAEYRERKREELRAKGREYYRANKEAVRGRIRQWLATNAERYAATCARWKRANVEKCRATAHRRRVLVSLSPDHWTPEQWETLKEACGRRCLCCGRGEPEVKLTPDHVIPVSRGGHNGIGNIQSLCFACNNKKQTRATDYRPDHIKALFEKR
jgi:5-methylcytosine-specific restriction endonuclease McrA